MNRADGKAGSIRRTALVPVAVGIDSLYLSVFIDGLKIDWVQLEYERENLLFSPGREFSEITLSNESFALHRGGRKPYTYHLSNTAFHLWLGQRIRPGCLAQLSSELIWSVGLENALKRLHAIWSALGTLATRPDVITRVDAAFDFEIGCPDFQLEHFPGQVRTTSGASISAFKIFSLGPPISSAGPMTSALKLKRKAVSGGSTKYGVFARAFGAANFSSVATLSIGHRSKPLPS